MTKLTDSIVQITAGIRAVQQREEGEELKLVGAALKRAESHKYNVVEIGWQLLRLKEVTAHGLTGRESNNPPKVKSETVSDLTSFAGGFEAGVQSEFAIESRTARNYMTAACNAGLTAKSTAADVATLRKKKALAGKRLADLYAADGDSPAAKHAAGTREAELEKIANIIARMHAHPESARLAWMQGRSSILEQVAEFGCQQKTWRSLNDDEKERLRLTLSRLVDDMAAEASAGRKLAVVKFAA